MFSGKPVVCCQYLVTFLTTFCNHLIADFSTDTPTSFSISLTLLDGEKLFLTMEIILWKCTLVFICGPPDQLVQLSWSGQSFFLRMYHGVDLSIRKVDLTLIKVLISIIGLFGAFSLLMASFNFTDISSDPIVRVLVESSQVQHLQSSPDLLSD